MILPPKMDLQQDCIYDVYKKDNCTRSVKYRHPSTDSERIQYFYHKIDIVLYLDTVSI